MLVTKDNFKIGLLVKLTEKGKEVYLRISTSKTRTAAQNGYFGKIISKGKDDTYRVDWYYKNGQPVTDPQTYNHLFTGGSLDKEWFELFDQSIKFYDDIIDLIIENLEKLEKRL